MQEVQESWVCSLGWEDPWRRAWHPVFSLGWEDPWRRAWHLVFFPGESMDRGAWQATVCRVSKSQTQLKLLSMHGHRSCEFMWNVIKPLKVGENLHGHRETLCSLWLHFLLCGFFWQISRVPSKGNCIYSTEMRFHFAQLKFQRTQWGLYSIHRGGDLVQVRIFNIEIRLVQFSLLVISDALDPMDCSMPDFPVHHQPPELAQTHVHRVGDAIQPFYPL